MRARLTKLELSRMVSKVIDWIGNKDSIPFSFNLALNCTEIRNLDTVFGSFLLFTSSSSSTLAFLFFFYESSVTLFSGFEFTSSTSSELVPLLSSSSFSICNALRFLLSFVLFVLLSFSLIGESISRVSLLFFIFLLSCFFWVSVRIGSGRVTKGMAHPERAFVSGKFSN